MKRNKKIIFSTMFLVFMLIITGLSMEGVSDNIPDLQISPDLVFVFYIGKINGIDYYDFSIICVNAENVLEIHLIGSKIYSEKKFQINRPFIGIITQNFICGFEKDYRYWDA